MVQETALRILEIVKFQPQLPLRRCYHFMQDEAHLLGYAVEWQLELFFQQVQCYLLNIRLIQSKGPRKLEVLTSVC
jgi:hypothetical protein